MLGGEVCRHRRKGTNFHDLLGLSEKPVDEGGGVLLVPDVLAVDRGWKHGDGRCKMRIVVDQSSQKHKTLLVKVGLVVETGKRGQKCTWKRLERRPGVEDRRALSLSPTASTSLLDRQLYDRFFILCVSLAVFVLVEPDLQELNEGKILVHRVLAYMLQTCRWARGHHQQRIANYWMGQSRTLYSCGIEK